MRRHSGVDVVRLVGELDGHTLGRFAAALEPLLAAPRPRVVVDVTGLGFCDSGGLRELLGLQRRAESAGGALRLIGVHGSLARLLTVAQLVDRFPPYDSLEHACSWPATA
ncbi:STAS domain-containing protein [Nonomuraea sp. 3-1Str]|uniref:STAS domain-containing protein n=1 Tax=Nonomuraea sp. 3-1Str TaxID=2929801 RepID=UPI0028611E1E|nr:STAS domain-containing protein [Nonomuraea sp. 3-1Str]MDR8412823.1 STAS domain-containing protein [Nonomuraea sp. 3-1Str]